MSMVGMNIGDVRNIGNQLKHQADEIVNAMTQIDGLIQQALGAWQGPDATQFHDWWVQQHKPALHNVSEAVRGLGQSALNNAQEQEDISNR
jgi:uncharacterized protein YukE